LTAARCTGEGLEAAPAGIGRGESTLMGHA